MSRDQIVITGIRGIGFHGVFDYERRDGQEFAVDITVFLEASTAASTDDLKNTVDYGAVSQVVFDRIVGEPVSLIETLAEQIAADILKIPGVEQVEVTVHKPQAPIPVPFENVALRILRP
ncbi:MAG: dihydroneopterin aldolase [Actinomycetota bacterium]|nr:dihydroneopterin aldolase [Actinomycetota bacterium]MDP2287734.1 dihydroneopterin aldolase [Actinomycetota bacterium]